MAQKWPRKKPLIFECIDPFPRRSQNPGDFMAQKDPSGRLRGSKMALFSKKRPQKWVKRG